jgi:hypothetical protein
MNALQAPSPDHTPSTATMLPTDALWRIFASAWYSAEK